MIRKDAMLLGLLQELENSGVCFDIRKNILNDESKVCKDEYDTACFVFNETSEEYFKLGFEVCRLLLLQASEAEKIANLNCCCGKCANLST